MEFLPSTMTLNTNFCILSSPVLFPFPIFSIHFPVSFFVAFLTFAAQNLPVVKTFTLPLSPLKAEAENRLKIPFYWHFSKINEATLRNVLGDNIITMNSFGLPGDLLNIFI